MRARRISVAPACTAVAASLCMIPASAQDDVSARAVRAIATRLDIPWDIEFLPDGSGIFTERDTKKIKKINGTTVTELDTVEQARTTGGEGGLLGLAVSRTFATDNTVYIYYSTGADNRISRLTLGGTPRPIVTGIPKNKYHNGGGLEFGPDGFLWATTGDAQHKQSAQDWNSLGGQGAAVRHERQARGRKSALGQRRLLDRPSQRPGHHLGRHHRVRHGVRRREGRRAEQDRGGRELRKATATSAA